MSTETTAVLAIYSQRADVHDKFAVALEKFQNISLRHTLGNIRQAIANSHTLQDIQILVVDLSGEPDFSQAIRELVAAAPSALPIIAMGERNDMRLYQELLDIGAREYLLIPLEQSAVSRCVDTLLTRSETSARITGHITDPIVAGRSIAVCGIRGNCGASTIAMRLARLLTLDTSAKALLIDANFISGDLAAQCDIQANSGFFSAISAGVAVDDILLTRSAMEISENLDLLATDAPLDSHFDITRELLKEVLDEATNQYSYIVAELPSHQLVGALPAGQSCDTLILVSDARLGSAMELTRWRLWLERQANPPTVFHILNLCDAPNALSKKQFVAIAGKAPDIAIPVLSKLPAESLLGLRNNLAHRELDDHLRAFAQQITNLTSPALTLAERLKGFFARTFSRGDRG